jgi:hypothetical protein
LEAGGQDAVQGMTVVSLRKIRAALEASSPDGELGTSRRDAPAGDITRSLSEL